MEYPRECSQGLRGNRAEVAQVGRLGRSRHKPLSPLVIKLSSWLAPEAESIIDDSERRSPIYYDSVRLSVAVFYG